MENRKEQLTSQMAEWTDREEIPDELMPKGPVKFTPFKRKREQKNQSDLSSVCKELELLIEGLATGKEKYRKEDAQYSLEEALDYLQEYLQELEALNEQIVAQGNTPELQKEVFKKYTELWLFQLYFPVFNLPRVIGPLMRYPDPDE